MQKESSKLGEHLKSTKVCDYLKALSVIVLSYIFSLRYIFPGYFRPLIPHHTDIFDYYYDFSNFKLVDFLKSARITGDFIISITGGVSYKLTIIFTILLTVVNIFFLVKSCEKIFNIKITMPILIVYSILVFSHPGFYINYTYDAFSTIAFTFVVIIIGLWYHEANKLNIRNMFIFGVLMFFCFTSKETYVVTIFMFWIFQAIANKGNKRKFATYMFLISVVIFGITILRSKIAGSPFVNHTDDISAAYFVSINPISVIKTWLYYFSGSINIYIFIILLFSLILSFIKKVNFIENLMLICMGLSAYFPYAVLPNHIVPHYQWLSVPLLYSVIFSLLKTTENKYMKRYAINTIAIIVLLLNLFTRYGYAGGYEKNSWAIKPESINYNILRSMEYIKTNLKPSEKVLITGLFDNEENPYKSMYYINDTLGYKVDITLATINVDDNTGFIKRKKLNNINLRDFDRVISYNSLGILIKDYSKTELEQIVLNEETEVLLYPELEEKIFEYKKDPNNWYTNMMLGNTYLSVDFLDKAEIFLMNAYVICDDTNPYPSFFMGKLMERRLDYKQALNYYKQASLIEPENKNFIYEINKVNKIISDYE